MVDGIGHVTSPLYPESYPKLLNCHTLLVAPAGEQVVLESVFFNPIICLLGHDIVIYDGTSETSQLIASCSSFFLQLPWKIVGTQGALFIVFKTNDQANNEPGFNITYYSEKSE